MAGAASRSGGTASATYQKASVQNVRATDALCAGTPSSDTAPNATSAPFTSVAGTSPRVRARRTANSPTKSAHPTLPTSPSSASWWRYQFCALSKVSRLPASAV